MGIGASDSKGVDADSVRSVVGPRGWLDGYVQLCFGEWDFRIRRLEVDVWWDCFVLEG